MRKTAGLLVLCCGLMGAAAAWGQGTSGFVGRVSPITTINRPIDTSNLVAPPPNFSSSFNLPGLFRRVKAPGFPPIVGQSNFPKPSSFASTKYKNAFNPVKPIIPRTK